MAHLFEVCNTLLGLYRERDFSPEFWAEPFNALTNAAFLIAAFFAWDYASRRRVATRTTNALLSLAGVIGFGSFFFHTIPNQFTMWLDIVPIALFQALFLWLVSNKMLMLSRLASVATVIGVVGSSFALFPIHKPLNGSLFYLPSLLAMLTIGVVWARRTNFERYLLVGAACCFLLAVTARSLDKKVPWHFDLLGAIGRAGEFLIGSSPPSPTVARPSTEKPGTQIAPTNCSGKSTTGARGVVHMAEQMEPVKRRVALKIIKPGMATRRGAACCCRQTCGRPAGCNFTRGP